MKNKIVRGITKVKRTPQELVALIRSDLAGKYASVAITIQRIGDSWTAVAEVDSAVTRERIENVARRVRKFNDIT